MRALLSFACAVRRERLFEHGAQSIMVGRVIAARCNELEAVSDFLEGPLERQLIIIIQEILFAETIWCAQHNETNEVMQLMKVLNPAHPISPRDMEAHCSFRQVEMVAQP